MRKLGVAHLAAFAAVVGLLTVASPALAASGPWAPARALQTLASPLASAARLGAAPAGETLTLDIPLVADTTGLQRFATAVSTPGSPSYGDYEPIAALARRFGASPAARIRVVGFLRRAGATDVSVDVTSLYVRARLRAGIAERLFGARLGRFEVTAGGSRGTTFVAPTAPTRLPAALRGAATGVVGLDTRPLPESPDASATTDSAYRPRTGTPTGCPQAVSSAPDPPLAQSGFAPNQYLTAYGFSTLQQSGITGTGERVALIEIDGFRGSDITTFTRCFGIPTPKVTQFGVGVSRPLPPGPESTLDLEILSAAAPGLKGIDVYESAATADAVLRSLTAPLRNTGHTPNVISASLGSCEMSTQLSIGRAGLRTVEASLALAAASGITVLASSGDTGSTACVNAKGVPLRLLAVNFPASSPFVTGVGGTNVLLDAANQIADPATDQIVWNDTPTEIGAGGGGISRLFQRPAYQNGLTASPLRTVPDVAMLADPEPGYEVYCTAGGACDGAGWVPFGGTSAGTPLLAGGFALVDEALRRAGRQDVGFANPVLYRIARGGDPGAVLDDVVANSNDLGQALFGAPMGCCTATPGLDQASGLGSVDVAALAGAAASIVPRIVTVGVSLPHQRPLERGALTARVSCTGACTLGAYARISTGGSDRPVTIYSRLAHLRRAGARTVTIGIPSKVLDAIRAALAAHRSVTATVYGAIADPLGNIERRSSGRMLHLQA